MVGQITSFEEHVAELTDRITLMEEELRRVRFGLMETPQLQQNLADVKPRPP